jgi:hypothetical protein
MSDFDLNKLVTDVLSAGGTAKITADGSVELTGIKMTPAAPPPTPKPAKAKRNNVGQERWDELGRIFGEHQATKRAMIVLHRHHFGQLAFTDDHKAVLAHIENIKAEYGDADLKLLDTAARWGEKLYALVGRGISSSALGTAVYEILLESGANGSSVEWAWKLLERKGFLNSVAKLRQDKGVGSTETRVRVTSAVYTIMTDMLARKENTK